MKGFCGLKSPQKKAFFKEARVKFVIFVDDLCNCKKDTFCDQGAFEPPCLGGVTVDSYWNVEREEFCTIKRGLSRVPEKGQGGEERHKVVTIKLGASLILPEHWSKAVPEVHGDEFEVLEHGVCGGSLGGKTSCQSCPKK